MRFRLLALVAALAVMAVLAPVSATAQPTLVPKSQIIYFGAGCPPANAAGSCESTEYFLSRQPGTSNIGNLASGLSAAQRIAAGGDYFSNAYAGDETLNDTYILQGDTTLTGQVVVGGYVGGAELAVMSGVEVVITAHEVGTQIFESIELVDVEIVKEVVTPGDRTYEFSVDIPAELDGVEIDALNATLGHDSLTVLGNGFVNGTGDSYFRLRYYEEQP